LGAAGLFLAASLHLRTWQRFEWVFPRLAVVACLFLFAALLQTTLFDRSILGLWPAPPIGAPLHATLINPNHAGGVLGALSALSLGAALGSEDRARRYALLLLYATLGGALILTLSRGAMLA